MHYHTRPPPLLHQIPKPTMPQCLGNEGVGPLMQVEQDEPYRAYLEEYKRLGDDFHSTMSFTELFNMKSRKRMRGPMRAMTCNFELQRTIGKVIIPNFDRGTDFFARSWVHKLNTYFHLHQMIETDAIKLATVHLDGEAHEWWYHGLVTLGHVGVTSYLNFTQRLIE
jgi:hypothetical protein